MMDDFYRQAAVAALKKMFAGNYFDICRVDSVLKLTGCIPNRKDYEALHALHCVHWTDMTPELRSMVFLKTMEMFQTGGFDLQLINEALTNARTHTSLLN